MADRGYDEMSASEVVADLHGPGYLSEDGEVWDGDEFHSLAEGEVVNTNVTATQQAKSKARKEYLKPFQNRVKSCARLVDEAEAALLDAQNDLERAEVNADRWYR